MSAPPSLHDSPSAAALRRFAQPFKAALATLD